MYLVTRMKTTMSTNIGNVDLVSEGCLGMMPVFACEKEAIEYAKASKPYAQVLELGLQAALGGDDGSN